MIIGEQQRQPFQIDAFDHGRLMTGMIFEWDSAKRAINLDKHGIDFEDAVSIWQQPTIDRFSTRFVNDEVRHLALGSVGPKPAGEIIIAVVYTMRHGHYRIISARKARDIERAAYRARFR